MGQKTAARQAAAVPTAPTGMRPGPARAALGPKPMVDGEGRTLGGVKAAGSESGACGTEGGLGEARGARGVGAGGGGG